MKSKSNYYVSCESEDARHYQVETLADGRYRVLTPGGEELLVDAFAPGAGQLHIVCAGQSLDAEVRADNTDFHVQLRGERHVIEVLNERQKRMAAAGIGGKKVAGPDLVSPMAGKIVAVTAQLGAAVIQGQTVVIVEAMKMENDLKAHRDGIVAAVHVQEGQLVEIGHVLVTIEDAP
ncbi:MAG: biotin/lipoyl-binding protein [Bradymonadaceae bacterium]|nr:biotin/lipoyl-binding protein [Lujinxingiaceae bacterium]